MSTTLTGAAVLQMPVQHVGMKLRPVVEFHNVRRYKDSNTRSS